MEDDPEKLHAFQTNLEARLATKNLELREEHSNDGRFGMSKAAGCTRQAGLKLLGHKPEPYSGSTKFTFWLGHLLEVVAICSLESLGYTVDGTQAVARIDPFMHSYSDGIVTGHGLDHILTVKSAGYKMSGKQRGKFVRRGFAELPFGGCKVVQPNWWAQVQAEMHGTGRKKALLVVVAKDIVKAFEEDEYLGAAGNGSLTFYCEEIDYDADWCVKQLLPAWHAEWSAVQRGQAGPALVLNNTSYRYVPLDRAVNGHMPNAAKTGTFNYCDYCDLITACREVA